MQYKVVKHDFYKKETFCAEFVNLDDAKLFINASLTADVKKGEKNSYRLFHGDTFLEELFQSALRTVQEDMALQNEKKAQAVFHPTPFSTYPVPSGHPHRSLIDKENEDEEEK